MTMTPAEVQALIIKRAREYATAQGRPTEGDNFARTALVIAGGESNFYPGAANGRGEQSIGVYELNFSPGSVDPKTGRKRGLTRDEARDPDKNITASLPELWDAFQRAGGSAAYATNPNTVVYKTWQMGQHPKQAALDSYGVNVIKAGVPAVADLAKLPQSLPTRPGGQTATGATTGATTTGTATADTNNPFMQDYLDIRTKYRTALDRLATLQQKAATTGLSSTEQLEINALPDSIKALHDAATQAWAVANPGKAETPSQMQNAQTAAGNLALDTQKFQHQQQMDSLSIVTQLATAVFGADTQTFNALVTVVKANQEDAYRAVDSMLRKQEITQAGAATILNAYNAQTVANAARSLDTLSRAKFINEARWQNAERLLPAGIKYNYGYAPDDPTNVLLSRLGLPKQVIEVQQVDRTQFDPLEQLRQADRSQTETGYGRPDFSKPIAAAEETYAGAQAIKPYTANPIMVNGQVPTGVTMPGSLDSYFTDWLGRVGGLMPPVGGDTTEPPPGLDEQSVAEPMTPEQIAAAQKYLTGTGLFTTKPLTGVDNVGSAVPPGPVGYAAQLQQANPMTPVGNTPSLMPSSQTNTTGPIPPAGAAWGASGAAQGGDIDIGPWTIPNPQRKLKELLRGLPR